MYSFTDALVRNGIALPDTATAAATYTPVTVEGTLAFVSGQLPRDESGVRVTGAVGPDVSLEAARAGCRLALIRGLAALRDALGDLDRVRRIVKMTVYVQSGPDFTDQSAVADAASELVFALLGPEQGRHARSAVGVFQLPRNASVEVELIASLGSA